MVNLMKEWLERQINYSEGSCWAIRGGFNIICVLIGDMEVIR